MIKKVLVTGGAGYIGSVLSSFLLDHKYEVVIIDDLSVGQESNIDKRSIFIHANILEAESLKSALTGVDLVIHCAAKSLVGESDEKRDLYNLVNIEGTRRLLSAMKSQNVKNIIFSSSCAVYGEPKFQPITENTTCNPVNHYGTTKLVCDQILGDEVLNDVAAVSFRFFNVSGGYRTILGDWVIENRNIETHIIPKVLRQMIKKDTEAEIRVYGNKWSTPDGSCVRDYLHVMDLALAHLLAVKNLQKGIHKIYNLGSGVGSSVFDVINAAQNVTARPIKSIIAEPRKGDPAVLLADISKANRELKWTPRFTLEDIISSSWQGLLNLN